MCGMLKSFIPNFKPRPNPPNWRVVTDFQVTAPLQ